MSFFDRFRRKATGGFEKASYLEEIDNSAVLDVANKIAYTPPA